MTCAQFKGSKRIVLPLGLARSAAHIAFTPPGRGPLSSCRKQKQKRKSPASMVNLAKACVPALALTVGHLFRHRGVF